MYADKHCLWWTWIIFLASWHPFLLLVTVPLFSDFPRRFGRGSGRGMCIRLDQSQSAPHAPWPQGTLIQPGLKRYSGICFLGILAKMFLLFSWTSTREGVSSGTAEVALSPQRWSLSEVEANSLEGRTEWMRETEFGLYHLGFENSCIWSQPYSWTLKDSNR